MVWATVVEIFSNKSEYLMVCVFPLVLVLCTYLRVMLSCKGVPHSYCRSFVVVLAILTTASCCIVYVT